jgi:hypothetical protein
LKAEQRRQQGVAGEAEVSQGISEADPVDEPEPERHRPQAPGHHRIDIVERCENDRRGDYRQNHSGRQADPAEGGETKRDRMGEREGGDHLDHVMERKWWSTLLRSS